jgi:hypothetical protein
MFHHIPAEEKGTTLRAVRRVLKPGGEFYMMDFEGPQGVHGLLSRVLHAQKTLLDDAELRVLTLMRLSGFSDAKNIGRRSLFLGGVGVLPGFGGRVRRPGCPIFALLEENAVQPFCVTFSKPILRTLHERHALSESSGPGTEHCPRHRRCCYSARSRSGRQCWFW